MNELCLDSDSGKSDLDIDSEEEHEPPPQPMDTSVVRYSLFMLSDGMLRVPTAIVLEIKHLKMVLLLLTNKMIFTKPYVDVSKK